MRNSVKTLLAALATMAAWSAPSQAQITIQSGLTSTASWNVMINNPGAEATTVTIYDTTRNVLTTDCLPAGASHTYSATDREWNMAGIYIRYQIYTAANICRGTQILDTSYGPLIPNPGLSNPGEITVAYPEQTVPPPAPNLTATAPQSPTRTAP